MPDVTVDVKRRVCPPYKSAEEEHDNQGNAVVQLRLRACHAQFVKEPMDVQEWGGELI